MRYAIFCVFLCATLSTPGQNFIRTEQIPLSAGTVIRKAVLTPAGQIYIAGSFQGNVSFGGTQLTSRAVDAFVAKYDRAKGFQWAKQGGGDLTDTANDLALDSAGNVCVVGTFQQVGAFDDTQLTAQGTPTPDPPLNQFVAKYDSEGRLLWVHQTSGKMLGAGVSIAVGPLGNVYSGGYAMNGLAQANSGTIDSWNSDGTHISHLDYPGDKFLVPRVPSIKVDDGGDVYIATDFVGAPVPFPVLVSDIPTSKIGYDAISITKFLVNGTTWTTGVTPQTYTGANHITAMALGQDQSVTATGQFGGTINFGETQLMASSNNDASAAGFVARWNGDGKIVWAQKLRDRGGTGTGLIVDSAGATYVSDSSAFAGVDLSKISADGNLLWTFQPDYIEKAPTYVDVAGTADRNYLLLVTAGRITMGGQTFTNVAGGDLFLSEFSEKVPPVFVANPSSVPTGFTNGGNIAFSAAVRSFAPVQYQWQHGGQDVVGQTNSLLTITNAQLADRGEYRLLASNVYGVSTSGVARLELYFKGAFHTAGSGNISVSPAAATYPAFSEISVLAQSDPGTELLRWSGDASGSDNPLRFVVRSNFVVKAIFSDYQTNIVIDDSEARLSGDKIVSGMQAATAYKGSYSFFSSLNPNNLKATYQPEIIIPGLYDIFVWYPRASSTRAALATYSLITPNATNNIEVDQGVSGGDWLLLIGSQFLDRGTNSFVQIGARLPFKNFVADGVRFVLRSPNVPLSLENLRLNAESVMFQLKSPTKGAFNIEVSTDLIEWSLFATLPSTNSMIEFMDTDVSRSKKFYRGFLE
jgi:hypothetical protein